MLRGYFVTQTLRLVNGHRPQKFSTCILSRSSPFLYTGDKYFKKDTVASLGLNRDKTRTSSFFMQRQISLNKVKKMLYKVGLNIILANKQF